MEEGFSFAGDVADGELAWLLIRQTKPDILQSLNTLDQRVSELQESAAGSGTYEENMESLELNIQVLTELIQEQLRKNKNCRRPK